MSKKPMIFSHDEPFEELKERNVVYTVRREQREPQDVWIRRTRTGPKEFDAEIFVNFKIRNWNILEDFVDQSGFESVEDWKEAIKENNDGELPEEAFLHGVQKLGHSEIRYAEVPK